METNRICYPKNIPLSKIQDQFWVLWNLSPLNIAYNIPLVYRINGKLNHNVFKSALQNVLDNHDILRASIELINNTPYFKVAGKCDIDEYYIAIRVNSDSSDRLFNEYVLAEVHKPFNISGDKLLRVRVFQFNNATFISIVFHHIIIDLHSKHVFCAELSSVYNNLIGSKEILIGLRSKQYNEYIAWHNEWLLSDEAGKMRNIWKTELDDPADQLELPYQLSTEKSDNSSGKRMLFEISPELSGKIDEFSKATNITPFVFILSAYAILLSRVCNQEKIIIGVPFSNRRQEEFTDTIGCFVNILPVSLDLGNKISIIDFIKQVRLALLKVHRKQELPYLELNASLNKNSQRPLFQVGYTFEGPVDLTLDDADTESVIIERDGAQLDIFLTLWQSKNNYCGFWEYNTDKFSAKSILRFKELLNLIIKSMLENPLELTHNFDLLTTNDRHFINVFNDTSCNYENDICLHQKFEKQVDKTPHAPALISNKITLSYKEADEHINRLANYLISKGVKPGDVVAISCERSMEMMIGILSILKAGACYLPLLIDNPSARMDEIICDSKPKLILSTKTGSSNISNRKLLVFIDVILENPLSPNASRPNLSLKSNSLAYILYTSGSTGKPKGTLIEHHSVMNRIGWMQKNYPLSPADSLLQKTPITFDVSVWELFWWFFSGSKLVLLNYNGEKDPMVITEYINKYAITQIHFVPSMFSPFLNFVKHNNLSKSLKTLRNMFLSGESLPPQLVAEFNQLRKTCTLPAIVNLYGPTEATVDVSYYNCSDDLMETDKVYIGKPIDNTCLYIVNRNLQIQPIGVKGELLITGVNLSRGYLNNPGLTNKSFVSITNPEGEILQAYKTGDIAVLNPVGEIEYLGRVDDQLKIRGMRVEPGEIESRLLQHPKIISVAVIAAFEGEHKALIAYVSPKAGQYLTHEEITEYMHTKVPPYMVPSQFIFIDTIPLTSSGKLNRKALPKTNIEIKSNSVIKPTFTNETELLNIWKEILQAKELSITDNFFDVGGNSLLAIKLAMRINQHFNKMVSVISVLEHSTIREYSKYLNTISKDYLDSTTQNIALAKEK
jgi:amino acid adenylation domain-containing protein